ncbi:MAG: hypothetical protein JWO50_64 [Candidatus Kaiserbacteria bacterium]|nr:hypothetical protein [Candidatus Kaiserbacteria bacterium]
MKTNAVRMHPVFLVLAAVTFFASIPFSHAFAAEYVTLNSFSGTPGTTLTLSGGGWNASTLLNIFFNGATSPNSTITTDSSANFSTSVQVPANASQGPFTFDVEDSVSHVHANNSFYVIPLTPSATFTAASHAPFANVAIAGSGFAPGEQITFELAGATGSTTADSSGTFSGSITVPQVTSGLYHINVTGNGSGATIPNYLNYFWIDGFYPSAAPSSYYLMPGATLSFNGSGFAAGETINVTETGTSNVLSTFTADASGSFTNAGGFALPAAFHGATKSFTLTGAQSHVSTNVGMTVGDFYAYASPSSYYLTPGSSLAFSGGGFAGNESVTVFQTGNTTPVTTFTTANDGTFTNAGSVTIPYSAAGGTISYTLSGVSSSASASVTTAVGNFYPSITPSSYYVIPNASVTITGSGFAPNETVSLSAGSATTTTTTDALGTFSAPIIIPFGGAGATILATGSQSNATAQVGVTLATFFPSIVPSSYYLYPGDSLTFTGAGFAPNENVTITSSGAATSTITTNSFGGFVSATTTVPFNLNGMINAHFIGALSGATADATVGVGSVSPFLSSDTYSASQGSTVHVTGTRFGANETVHVTAGPFSADVTTDSAGNTSAVAIPTPYGASNLHVVFTGNSTNASASLDIGLQNFNVNVTVDNYYAHPGATVVLSGSGFASNENVIISTGNASTTVAATAQGNISAPVVLPFNSSNTVTITATGVSSVAQGSVSVGLSPFAPQVTPSTYYTSAGTPLTFIGTGFAPNESVAVTVNGQAALPTVASATGTITYSYTTSYSLNSAQFVFTGNITNSPQTLTVSLAPLTAFITLSNYYAQGGTPLTITGSGFAPNEPVQLSTVGGTVFASTTANGSGIFTSVGTVPFAPAGNHGIVALGANSGAIAAATITIAPVYTSLSLGSYAGAPGDAVTFVGSGYLPNEPINITTDRSGTTVVYTFNADASGSFNNSGYIIPMSYTGGPLLITVTGAHSFDSKGINYYVTGA